MEKFYYFRSKIINTRQTSFHNTNITLINIINPNYQLKKIKRLMKKIFFALFALASVALTFSACSDDDEEKELTYPSYLSGEWTYTNASTGYTGSLRIEELYGGQIAHFLLTSPGKDEQLVLENTFKYDPKTGIATIASTVEGGISVTAQATKGTDKTLDITVTQIVSGGTKTKFTGKFTR